MIELVDTHCHIHEAAGTTDVADKWHDAGCKDPGALLHESIEAGVTRVICVGCTVQDSQLAVEFAAAHDGAWASIGMHPHEAKRYANDQQALATFSSLLTADGAGKIVAIGECGLDYYYNHSSKKEQEKILRFQLDLAQKHNLPVIFHVREAFDEFWPIFDEYKGLRGVIHSFTATQKELEQILQRGLYVGLNGIMTFTNKAEQLDAAKAVPLSKLLLETDAPFLTPQPFRAKINAPKYVQVTAKFLADLRGESLAELAKATTGNAQQFFGL